MTVIGSPHGEPRGHGVAFGDRLLQRPLDVGEGAAHHPDDFQVPIGPPQWFQVAGAWNTASGEMTSSARSSLPVLMNSTKRFNTDSVDCDGILLCLSGDVWAGARQRNIESM
ncbi:hypothetical protein STANM309S_00218 [Streptomyces tanashiensis]